MLPSFSRSFPRKCKTTAVRDADLYPLILFSNKMRMKSVQVCYYSKFFCVCVSEFKALKSYSRNRYSRSVSMTNSYPGNNSMMGEANWAQPIRDESEDEFSGMGGVPNGLALPNSLKVTHR